MFIGLVTCCFQLLHLYKRKGLSNQFPGSLLYQLQTHDYLVTNVHLACYMLFPVVTSLKGKVLSKQFPGHFCINFQPPTTLLHIFARLVTFCYQLEEKRFVNLVYTVYVCISFQPPTTLLYILAGLDTFCYQLLHLQKRKELSNQLPGLLLYQFPTHDYLVTYVHWPCYAFFLVFTSLEQKWFVKLVSWLNFVLVSNPRIHYYIYSLCLLRFVTSCYIFRREKVCQTSFQVHFCVCFQHTTTLLRMFIGLVTCCFQLLHLQKRNGLSNQFPGSLLY